VQWSQDVRACASKRISRPHLPSFREDELAPR